MAILTKIHFYCGPPSKHQLLGAWNTTVIYVTTKTKGYLTFKPGNLLSLGWNPTQHKPIFRRTQERSETHILLGMVGNLRNHRLQAPKLTHLSLQWSQVFDALRGQSCSRIPKFYFLMIGRVRLLGQFNPFFALAEVCSTGLPSDLPSDGLFHKIWLLKNYEASNHPHFSKDFTYIISFESHKILWVRQSWNSDLHITDLLRLREFERSSTGEWLSRVHIVFWLLGECLHDVFCSHSCIDHITLPFKYPFFSYSLPHWKRQYHQQQKYFSPYHPLSPAKNPSRAPAQLFPRAMFFQSSYAFCEPGDKSYQ